MTDPALDKPLLTSLTDPSAREQRQNDGVSVAAKLLGDLARRDEPIGPRTTYRVGGAASLFVEVTSGQELALVAEAVATSGVDVLVVGKGSNMLVSDKGFAGLAISLGEPFARVEIAGSAAAGAGESGLEDSAPDGAAEKFADAEEGVAIPREQAPAGAGVEEEAVTVRAGGAVFLPVAARQTVRAGLTGFEWAVGVPGSIGGAVRMNAGGHGSEMAGVLSGARIVDLRTGEDGVVPASGLQLGYRRSSVRAHQVVVWAELRLGPGDRAEGERQLSEIVAWRRANQPGGPNAGSVFTNPEGDSAGRLIDEAGCKGLRIGSAEVSTKHANFFQADRDGSADDVLALMREVQRRVHAATGVELHAETRLVGFQASPI